MDLISWGLVLLFIFGLFVMAPIGIIDAIYKEPQAAEKANQICQEQGYDFYESFERIGILSKEPVAIKCKYVDNYKEIDMNLRKISEE
ncbi:hypothetical protein LCGC14_3063040 [marine sediment metagenome]|uniref:Uncharacterized protein n=1 Tax=marine sediment metagenome TaxID=412755 RepID=A0A0F8YR16_9ZZZZ